MYTLIHWNWGVIAVLLIHAAKCQSVTMAYVVSSGCGLRDMPL